MFDVKRLSPSPCPAVARPGGIAAVFLLAAVPYLLFLDWLLLGAAPDAAALGAAQALKGWGLVLVAAGVMYLLERRLARRHLNALADQRAAYDAAIEGWARALDLRDHETEGHGRRVADLSRRLGERLGLVGAELEALRHGALLHDVGKIGVRDAVLRRRGPLDEEKWAEMRRHPVQGHELLADVDRLRAAASVVRSHHERWDGGGYPDGLVGEAIPKLARVFAVVDVYDALMSDRPYRPAWPEARVLAHLRRESARQFDPAVVTAFLDLLAHPDDDTAAAGVAEVGAAFGRDPAASPAAMPPTALATRAASGSRPHGM
jgi:HD-GYP domain-containing protein (c-di-GMP phosphodiesterase class II)